MLLKSSITGLALGMVLVSGSAFAYQKGDFVARAGAAAVDPRESSSELKVNGGDVAGSYAGVDGNTQLGLTFAYMVSDHVALELLGATPFSHTVTAYVPGLGTVDAAEVKHLPPTLSVTYFPLDSASALQPYVGIGLNYTTFFDTKVANDLKGVFGDGKVSLDDSYGLAFEVGCDYQVTDQIIVNAAVWKADIDTTANFKFDSGNTIDAKVQIDPMVYMLAVGYKF